MALLTQSTAYTRMFLMILSSDHVSPATGKTVTVSLSKAGGAFAGAAGTVTEVANGWYKVALTTVDSNTTGDLVYNCTATACDPTDFVDQVIAYDINGTALPTNFATFSIDSSGRVTIAPGEIYVKKGVAFTFTFPMFDSTNHQMVTGKTITSQISKDGGTVASTTNSATEISNGFYSITLTATEMTATQVAAKFSATGCDDMPVLFITQP